VEAVRKLTGLPENAELERLTIGVIAAGSEWFLKSDGKLSDFTAG